jgi:hypothetical protein
VLTVDMLLELEDADALVEGLIAARFDALLSEG